ncbi:unnamed protein product [Prorocentrum cordatum]|uniref:Uncharacterized protein n=1 Tax=Prorocentrum cordatum TaxID=2364126 RepID=A0ABN9U5L9_9DINO|nr:unnamed protein product [Polarella glacialis]
MVEHESAVALRGRMYKHTHNRKDTCNTISFHAQVPCMSPTSPPQGWSSLEVLIKRKPRDTWSTAPGKTGEAGRQTVQRRMGGVKKKASGKRAESSQGLQRQLTTPRAAEDETAL